MARIARITWCHALAAALAVLAPSAPRAGEYATYAPLHLDQPAVASSPSVLTVPGAWQPGDVAALVVLTGEDRHGLSTRLIADLVQAGVAVAELVVPARAPAEAILADVQSAIIAVRADFAAGPVLGFAIDDSQAATAVLRAADPLLAGHALGGNGARLDAAAALGRGCRAITPLWNEPDDWRLLAIFDGEALARAPEPARADALAAQRCAMAVVPPRAWTWWPPARIPERPSWPQPFTR